MDLPTLPSDIAAKRVLLRADLDVDEDESRLKILLPTLEFLLKGRAKLVIIGHKGRPQGTPSANLSLAPISEKLGDLLGTKIKFVMDMAGEEAKKTAEGLKEAEAMMLENLRFDSREESNNLEFAKSLASFGDLYVNEAFAASHRDHASIVGIPKLLPHFPGLRFVQEVKNLSMVFESPKKPVIVIIGGAKEDKLSYVDGLKSFADKIYLTGALPKFLEQSDDPKVVVANLLPDKEDITINSIEKIEADLASAGTIILSGPIGKFEEEGHRLGTKRVFEAITKSNAVKIAGGGDTQAAIRLLGLTDRFDWISTGGGAMLEFLAKRTLPGIKALLN